ncbi:MAG: LOG family protein, partial [Ignavibacteriaceae bacterium]|nr:LOG family protein [Ignavibacteriaceae bacterium]
MNNIVTVFGSSLPEPGDDEYAVGYELGKQLALNKFDVCTGGYKGIMEAVSKGALDNGSRSIGITLGYIKSKPNKYLTEEIKCYDLFERINKLIELGSGYVVLQGGTGTLLELAAVWELMNKKLMA